MTRKIYVDGFVFLSLNVYRRYLSPRVWKLCRIPDILLVGEDIIFSNNTFVFIFQKINITVSYLSNFWVNILNHGKNLQDLRGQNPCKNVEVV